MEANKERTDTHRGRVLLLLDKRIPEDHKGMERALREAEACYIGIVTARVRAHTQLVTMREKWRHPKDKDLTDMDRKTMLDAATVEEQAMFDELAGIEKALEQRISVIQALLVQ